MVCLCTNARAVRQEERGQKKENAGIERGPSGCAERGWAGIERGAGRYRERGHT